MLWLILALVGADCYNPKRLMILGHSVSRQVVHASIVKRMSAVVFSSISASAGKSAIAAAAVRHLATSGAKLVASAELEGGLAEVPQVRYLETVGAKVPRGRVGVFEGGSGTASEDVALADDLDAHIVLVASYGEDVVSAASEYGDRLAGVVWNKVPRYRRYDLEDACAELAASGVKCLGFVPEDRVMSARSVSEVVQHLGADQIIDGDDGDSLIETFLVGGLVLDWGPMYFESEPSTCVVVRSGRPDVQISALQSETTRAVLMTGGGKPIDYVFYEARAKGVPLLVTEHDTLSVMNLLDDLPSPSFAFPVKSERMCELLESGEVLSRLTDLVAAPATR